MRNIGFIGLGLMGSPMAKRLLNSGYKLNIWNRTKSKVISFSKVGANKVGDLNDIAKMSDVLITMLKDDDAVIEILESKANVDIYRAELVNNRVPSSIDELDEVTKQALKDVLRLSDVQAQNYLKNLKNAPCKVY